MTNPRSDSSKLKSVPNPMDWVTEWTHRLRRFADRIWYLPFISFLAFIDLFILLIPTDFLLVTYVLLKPKKWIAAMIWISLGSAFGALALAGILQYGGAELVEQWFPRVFQSGHWSSTSEFVRKHGAPALALISVSILPQQPGVVIAALSRMPLFEIFLSVLVGRLAKYALFSWLASHAPKQLERFALGRAALAEVKVKPAPILKKR